MNLYEWVNVNQVTAFLLIAIRLSGVFMISPLFSNRAVPARIKIALIVMLSISMLPIVARVKMIQPNSSIQLIVWAIQEVSIGVIIGFVASILFAAVTTAGDLIGMQIGYSMAQIFDPANETDSGVITSFYVILAGLLFLYLDGHHLILSAMTRSFEILPIGKGFNLQGGYTITELTANVLVAAIQIASPAIFVVLILNFMFGLITKLSPQMNIYFNAGLVVGPILGIIVLMVTLPLFRVLIMQMTERLNPEMLKMIHALKGT